MKRGFRTRRSVALVLAAVLAASCGGAPATPSSAVATEHPTASPVVTPAATPTPALPLAIENCGLSVAFKATPARVVSADPRFTEILLALGLRGSIVGTLPAYSSELRPDLAASYASIPLIGQNSPTLESVVAAKPDFVWASPFFFTDKSLGPRESWQAKGINTYVPAGSCRTDASSIEDTYADIGTLGKVMGAVSAADVLVAGDRAKVAEVVTKLAGVAPVRVFVYALLDPGNPPFTRGFLGIANDILTSAGGANVFASLGGFTKQVSWEEVVAQDPDVIVVLDADDAQAKISELKANPISSKLRAVKTGRIVVVPIHAVSTPDLHNAEAVSLLANGLHPDIFK